MSALWKGGMKMIKVLLIIVLTHQGGRDMELTWMDSLEECQKIAIEITQVPNFVAICFFKGAAL